MGKKGAESPLLLKIIAGQTKPKSRLPFSSAKRLCRGLFTPAFGWLRMTARNGGDLQSIRQLFSMKTENRNESTKSLTVRTDTSGSYYKQSRMSRNWVRNFSPSRRSNYEAEVEKVLLGLGFERADFQRLLRSFWTVWRMRIELAKILLQKPNSDPSRWAYQFTWTIESIQWLEDFFIE